MGRILDPDWKQFTYVPAAQTDLKTSMERYKEMVKNESLRKLHHGTQTGHDGGNHAPLPSEPVNGVQGRKFAVVAGKGS